MRFPKPSRCGLVAAFGACLGAACTEANPAYVRPGVSGPPEAAAKEEIDSAAPPDAPAPDAAAGPDARADAPVGDAAGVTADAPSVPTAGLVAHWPLDEAAANTNATLREGARWSSESAPGTSPGSSSVVFDGMKAHVELAVQGLPMSEDPKTIALWFRNASITPRLRNLVALFNQTNDAGIHLGFDGARLAAWRFGDFNPIVTSPTSLDSEWHHAAYTYDGTVHRLYLDGGATGTPATDPVFPGRIARAMLGSWQPPMEMFKGQIDDVRIYDRALSTPEIAALARRN